MTQPDLVLRHANLPQPASAHTLWSNWREQSSTPRWPLLIVHTHQKQTTNQTPKQRSKQRRAAHAPASQTGSNQQQRLVLCQIFTRSRDIKGREFRTRCAEWSNCSVFFYNFVSCFARLAMSSEEAWASVNVFLDTKPKLRLVPILLSLDAASSSLGLFPPKTDTNQKTNQQQLTPTKTHHPTPPTVQYAITTTVARFQ